MTRPKREQGPVVETLDVIDLSRASLNFFPQEVGFYIAMFIASGHREIIRCCRDEEGELCVEATGIDVMHREKLWRYRETWLFSKLIKIEEWQP